MSVLQFLSSVIDTLAWPVTVVVLSVLFRDKLRALLHGLSVRLLNLTEVSAPGFSAKFSEQVALAQSQAEEVRKQRSEVDQGEGTVRVAEATDLVADLVGLTPRVTVIEAFIKLEAVIIQTATAQGWSGEDRRGPLALRPALTYLEQRGIVSKSVSQLIDTLRRLRNEAAHHQVFDIEASVVEDYVRTVLEVITYLKTWPQ